MKGFAWRLVALCCCLCFNIAMAADKAADKARDKVTDGAAPPARVMLIGLFHFDNPGLDAVKYKPLDVMKPTEQAYLQALTERIKGFKPTKVLLEYSRDSDALINRRYADYLAGKYELKVNEIYQLGFRIAKAAGLSRVHGFDERDPPGDDALWLYLPKEEPEIMKMLEGLIASMSTRMENEHRTLSLRDILVKSNSAEEDRANKDFYIMLNAVGADKGKFIGADASAQWWQRNFRMYANVQMHAQAGERVVVVAGSGHTAILRDLLRIDTRRVEESAQKYF